MEVNSEQIKDQGYEVESALTGYLERGEAKPVVDAESKRPVGAIFQGEEFKQLVAVSNDGSQIAVLEVDLKADDGKVGNRERRTAAFNALTDQKSALLLKVDPGMGSEAFALAFETLNNPHVKVTGVSYIENEECIEALRKAVQATDQYRQSEVERVSKTREAVRGIFSTAGAH